MLHFACPHCNQELTADETYAGTTMICSRCQGQMVAPAIPDVIPIRSFVPFRFEDAPEWVQGLFPYFLWCPVGDGRTSPMHARLERRGLNRSAVYRRDDPLFASWFAARANGVRPCRCTTIDLTVEAAGRHGAKEAQRWRKAGIPPTSPKWAKPLRVDPFVDNECELMGWGRGKYDDSLYADHAGNPDKWQE